MSGGGKSSGRRFADDFHRNKRHTFHFPDKENYCEDLNFSKKLSSSSKNISDASAGRLKKLIFSFNTPTKTTPAGFDCRLQSGGVIRPFTFWQVMTNQPLKIVLITKGTLWRFYFAEHPTTFHDFCGTGAADATQTSFLHIDKEIPMQSASLEAQKFKTIIFLSGQ